MLQPLLIGALGRLRQLVSPAMRWYYPALAWAAFVLCTGMLLGIRVVKASGLARMIEFKDIPILQFTVDHYGGFAWGAAGLGGLCAALAGWWWWRQRGEWPRLLLFVGALASATLMAAACRYTLEPLETAPPGLLDWLLIAAVTVTPLAYTWACSEHMEELGPWPAPAPAQPGTVLGLSLVYLLCVTSVFAHSVLDHLRMWDPASNGGYRYARFFAAGEVPWAHAVLFSTSLLFASLAALAACAWALAYRVLLPRRPETAGFADMRRQAKLAAGVLALSAMGPWMTRLAPEISAERAWHLPVGYVAFTFAVLLPLVFAGGVLLERDFTPPRPPLVGARPFRLTRAERTFLAWVLFPVYPWLRPLRPRSPRLALAGLLLLASAVLAGATWAAFEADELWEFEDWRGMMKVAQFPYTRVFLSLAVAGGVLVVGQRAIAWWEGPGEDRERPAAGRGRRLAGLATGALAFVCLLGASWPFWGWGRVPRNVLARAVEFNDRHQFERRFLHWALDLDRDGYAGLLQGGDPDDLDAAVQGGGLPALRPVALPVDEMVLLDPAKARSLPSMLLIYLEGVTPRSISAYGQRRLDRPSTPGIDAVAADGTRFTRARCAYPSTWDGWFMTLSGRLTRIQEMDASRPFLDRYSRYNNLQKVLELAGYERWCQPDTNPYVDMLVPAAARARNWEPDFDAEPTWPEVGADITRGDKRNERILRFIDSLQPGQRFFIAEHMADAHFPWRRTPTWRAAELGYPEGLGWVERDATIDGEFNDRLARYYHAVTRMDSQIRDIVARLRERGLYDETLIVILSDHGCQWYEHEHGYYVSHLYEQSLLLPLIVKVPGLPGGRSCDVPVVQMDLLPTIMELAGVGLADPGRPLYGVSLAPLLDGPPPDAAQARRWSERELLLTTHYDTLGYVRGFRDKLIYDRPTGTALLFDLEADPMEMHNLADERPELLREMMDGLRRTAEEHMHFLGGLAPSE